MPDYGEIDFPLVGSTKTVLENTTNAAINVTLAFEAGSVYRLDTIVEALEGVTGISKSDDQHKQEGVNPFDGTIVVS